MTRKEYLKQGVDILRADLLTIFEDPDGELAEMTKPHLIVFAKENWDTIEDSLASRIDTAPEEEPAEDVVEPEPSAEPEEEGVEEDPLDLEPEPTTGETESLLSPSEDKRVNPGTNLA